MYSPYSNMNFQQQQQAPAFQQQQQAPIYFQQQQQAPAPSYSSSNISAAQYSSSSCGSLPETQTMSVPQYTHVVHRMPVIYETTTVETSYVQVPVSHKFEARDYPQQMAAQCPVQQAAAPAPCAVQQAAAAPCGSAAGYARMGW
jgi:hypothetical protein